MIGKLKIKFIALSMLSLLLLLTVLVAGMNLLNYRSVVKEADEILALLSKNKGRFPDMGGNKLPPHMSPELPYESRYFSVVLNETGSVPYVETGRITSVDTETAIEYADEVMQRQEPNGFVAQFRFARSVEDGAVRLTFLDCGRKLDAYYNFLFTSTVLAGAGYLVVFFVICFFAGKFIRPIAESYEKQKRFITDAGHEIKTPLTIIAANADILEMELENNECLEDIRLQTKRLSSLTNDLVYLARMEEAASHLHMIEFPISEIVSDSVSPFKTLAQSQEKTFLWEIQPMLSANGDTKAIERLVSILMDNAFKYSPMGGTVSVKLSRQNRAICLKVYNTVEAEIDPKSLDHVFDRFYRTDLSRNSQTGGHGIGLSVAQAIVNAHNGKISARTQDGRSFEINVVLPM